MNRPRRVTESIATVERMKRQINGVLDRTILLLQGGSPDDNLMGAPAWSPAIDVLETQQQYLICLDVPGVERTDINIELTPERMIIKGVRNPPWSKEGPSCQVLSTERLSTAFERSVQLGGQIDQEEILTSLESGVLRIVLPKKRGRTITLS